MLYETRRIDATDYVPVIKEPTIESDINWCTAYFISKKKAERFARECGCRNRGVEYNEDGDVYSVNYHRSDNPSYSFHDNPVDEKSDGEKSSVSSSSSAVHKITLK